MAGGFIGHHPRGLCEHAMFQKIEAAARVLGFDYCAYGLRAPYPLSNPQTVVLSNYHPAWQQRYTSENYVKTDPSVVHGRRSVKPLVWSDTVFAPPQPYGTKPSLSACALVGRRPAWMPSEPWVCSAWRALTVR